MTQNDSAVKLLAHARNLHMIDQLFLIVSAAVKFRRIRFSVVTSAASAFAGFAGFAARGSGVSAILLFYGTHLQ